MAEQDEHDQDNGDTAVLELLAPQEIKAAIQVGKQEAKAAAGYLNRDGTDNDAVVNAKLRAFARTAKPGTRPERAERSHHRDDVMAHMYPGVPGRAQWEDLPEDYLDYLPEEQRAEVAEGIYKDLDGELWRKLSDEPEGAIQASLEDGEVLCRTKVKTGRLDSIYVTTNRECWETDLIAPRQKEVEKKHDAYAAVGRMMMERQPEHATRVQREFVRTSKDALEAGNKIMRPALEAAKAARADADPDEVE